MVKYIDVLRRLRSPVESATVSRGRLKSTTALRGGLAAALLAAAAPHSAQALPQGGTVVAGTATISQSGNQLKVVQATPKAAINWQSYTISANETVTYYQPCNQAIILNRVLGGGASAINGRLTANGQVWISNPSGIFFGPNARVNVGGLIATTHDLKVEDFNADRYHFLSDTQPSGILENQGRITVADAGLAAFVAPGVVNHGTITARLGQVVLASGNEFTVDLYGDQKINLAIDNKTAQQVFGRDGKLLDALVKSDGKIFADGGRVQLTAAAAKGLVDNVVSVGGVVQARSVEQRDGEIVLFGDGGTVHVGGTLDASGKAAGQKGGIVTVSGNDVQVTNGARIDVSGAAGGGQALIGGDFRGGTATPDEYDANALHPPRKPVPPADTTTVESGAVITADALSIGRGGEVIVWSTDATSVHGTLTARGGSQKGDGGFIETSGHELDIGGAYVDARATTGTAGNWLLDPYSLTVGPADATSISSALGGASVTLETTDGNSSFGTVFASGNGDITISSAITWSGDTTLTLDAYRGVQINAPLTATNSGAGLTVIYNHGGNGGALLTGVTGPVVGYVTMPTDSHLSINGNNYNLIGTWRGLNSIWSSTQDIANLSKHYALVGDIAAPNASNFVPIGFNSINNNAAPYPFIGAIEGLGHTITGLSISSANADNLGLISRVGSAGVVRNIYLIGGSVTGIGQPTFIGMLAGRNDGQIINTSASGSVTGDSGSSQIGGLIGINYGAVVSSSASINVNGWSNSGGLVGENDGILFNVFAAGSVVGGYGADRIGGLVGSNSGWILSSQATGTVTAGANSLYVGGLAGENSVGGTISASTATGAVSCLCMSWVGGLVGLNAGSVVSNSLATGSVTVGDSPTSVGGLVGQNQASGIISGSYAAGTVSAGSSAAYVGGLVGANYGSVATSYASGSVSAGSSAYDIGGIAGYNSRLISASYYDAIGSVSTGIVTAGSSAYNVGGLVGENVGTVSTSYSGATLITDHSSDVGGLVGFNNGGRILTSYTTGAVDSGIDSTKVGGLVGENAGTVVTSYAKGGVVGGASSTAIGGLIGQNSGVVSSSYATGSVGGGAQSQYLGGLIGYDSDGTIAASHATGAVTGGASSYDIGGLIGSLATDGSTLSSSYASGTVRAGESSARLGGLVGSNAGTVGTSYAVGSVSAGAGSTGLGGLVGKNTGTVTYSWSSVTVTGNAGGAGQIGGLVGINDSTGTVIYSYSTGDVTGGGTGYYDIGGLVGLNYGTVQGTYATGAVTSYDGGDNIGGLVGNNTNLTGAGGAISDSFASGTVSYPTTPTAAIAIGALVGLNQVTGVGASGDAVVTGLSRATGDVVTNTGGTPSTTHVAIGINAVTAADHGTWCDATSCNPYAQSTYGAIFSFGTNLSGNNPWYIVDGKSRPFLVSEYSTNITNAHQLQLMALDSSAHYTLSTNIDMAELTWASGLWSVSTGFVPVGDSTHPFVGSLDGVGHVIQSLTINNSAASYQGLFGDIGAAGEVERLGLVGAAVTGGGYVGILAGVNGGTITSVYATGTVSNPNGGIAVGGLVGQNSGTISASYSTANVTNGPGYSFTGGMVGENTATGTLTSSYASGMVSAGAGATDVGGLAGASAGVISRSYATGTVSAVGDNSVGGLIGLNTGAVSSSYATGFVAGGSGVGGLAGVNSGVGATIGSSYEAGGVSGTGFTAALVGDNTSGTVLNSVWSTDPPGQPGTGIGSGGVATGNASAVTSSVVSNALTTLANVTSWYQVSTAVSPILLASPYVLTVTAPTSATYGTVLPTSFSNFWGSDTAAVVQNLNVSADTALMTGTQLLGAGAHSMSYSGGTAISAATGQGYTLAYVGGNVSVTPKTLTLSGVPVQKIYNGTANASPLLYLGVAESAGFGSTADGRPYVGQTVSLSGTFTASYDSANVDAASLVTVTGLSLSGTDASNYQLQAATTSVWGSITPKVLTVSGFTVPSSKTYDGTITATVTSTPYLATAEAVGSGSQIDGVPYVGDAITLTGTPSAIYSSASIGTGKWVSFGGLSLAGGVAAHNYTLAQGGTYAAITAAVAPSPSPSPAPAPTPSATPSPSQPAPSVSIPTQVTPTPTLTSALASTTVAQVISAVAQTVTVASVTAATAPSVTTTAAAAAASPLPAELGGGGTHTGAGAESSLAGNSPAQVATITASPDATATLSSTAAGAESTPAGASPSQTATATTASDTTAATTNATATGATAASTTAATTETTEAGPSAATVTTAPTSSQLVSATPEGAPLVIGPVATTVTAANVVTIGSTAVGNQTAVNAVIAAAPAGSLLAAGPGGSPPPAAPPPAPMVIVGSVPVLTAPAAPTLAQVAATPKVQAGVQSVNTALTAAVTSGAPVHDLVTSINTGPTKLTITEQKAVFASVPAPKLVSGLMASPNPTDKAVGAQLQQVAGGNVRLTFADVKAAIANTGVRGPEAQTYLAMYQVVHKEAMTTLFKGALTELAGNPRAADLPAALHTPGRGTRGAGTLNATDASPGSVAAAVPREAFSRITLPNVSTESDAAGRTIVRGRIENWQPGMDISAVSGPKYIQLAALDSAPLEELLGHRLLEQVAETPTNHIQGWSGGRQVRINGRWIFVRDDGSFEVPLPAGTTSDSIKLSIVDETGTIREQTVPAQQGAAGGPARAQQPRKIAVLFANSDYSPNGIPDLHTPSNDVARVSEVLHNKLGFVTRVIQNATKADIAAAIEALHSEATETDQVFIYYAGHGYENERTGVGYWLPVDASTTSAKNWVSTKDVARLLRRVPAKHIMLVADSCYSGSFTKEKNYEAGKQGANLNELGSLRGVMAMSSGGDEPVMDGETNSPFARALVDRMKEIASTTVGEELYTRVKADVIAATPQTPQYGIISSAGYDPGADYLIRQSRAQTNAR